MREEVCITPLLPFSGRAPLPPAKPNPLSPLLAAAQLFEPLTTAAPRISFFAAASPPGLPRSRGAPGGGAPRRPAARARACRRQLLSSHHAAPLRPRSLFCSLVSRVFFSRPVPLQSGGQRVPPALLAILLPPLSLCCLPSSLLSPARTPTIPTTTTPPPLFHHTKLYTSHTSSSCHRPHLSIRCSPLSIQIGLPLLLLLLEKLLSLTPPPPPLLFRGGGLPPPLTPLSSSPQPPTHAAGPILSCAPLLRCFDHSGRTNAHQREAKERPALTRPVPLSSSFLQPHSTLNPRRKHVSCCCALLLPPATPRVENEK